MAPQHSLAKSIALLSVRDCFMAEGPRDILTIPIALPQTDEIDKSKPTDGAITYFTGLASKDRSAKAYIDAVNALNVLVVSFQKRDTAQRTTVPEPIIVCQIVDTSAPPAGPSWYDNPVAPLVAGVGGLLISMYIVRPMLGGSGS